jgi:hypothetical protein
LNGAPRAEVSTTWRCSSPPPSRRFRSSGFYWSAANGGGPEIDSRKSLVIAADASRRETVSALTSSMAHDLSQPLSLMIFNARALRGMARIWPRKSSIVIERCCEAGG